MSFDWHSFAAALLLFLANYFGSKLGTRQGQNGNGNGAPKP